MGLKSLYENKQFSPTQARSPAESGIVHFMEKHFRHQPTEMIINQWFSVVSLGLCGNFSPPSADQD